MTVDVVTGAAGVPDHIVTRLAPRAHPTALVIPILNEGDRIIGQLRAIQEFAPAVDVVIADGGSTDGSTDLALLNDLGVSALLVKTGPGRLSAQLRMAIHFCLAEGYEAIITMDGNGKDGVAGIERIRAALADGFDFVQGSRFVRGGIARNTPFERYAAIRLIHAPLTSIASRHWFTDTTNGFRGHSRRLLASPDVAPLRDVFDSYELLAYLPIRAARLGYRVCEVPVSRVYPVNAPTPTKIHGIQAHSGLMQTLTSAARGRFDPKPSREPA